MSNVIAFPHRSIRPARPCYAGTSMQVEGRIAILETIARIAVRGVVTPYEQAALLAKLRVAIQANCAAHKLSAEDRVETIRYAERLLDDIIDSAVD